MMELQINRDRSSEERKPSAGGGTSDRRYQIAWFVRATAMAVLTCLLISCSTLRTALDADTWFQDNGDMEISRDKHIQRPPMAEDLDRPMATDPE